MGKKKSLAGARERFNDGKVDCPTGCHGVVAQPRSQRFNRAFFTLPQNAAIYRHAKKLGNIKLKVVVPRFGQLSKFRAVGRASGQPHPRIQQKNLVDASHTWCVNASTNNSPPISNNPPYMYLRNAAPEKRWLITRPRNTAGSIAGTESRNSRVTVRVHSPVLQ